MSECSSHPEQTPARILRYAKDNGLNTVCLTDHFWDETVPGASDWYKPQNFAHINRFKPLPQDKNVRFLFGCETEMDKYCKIGISKERMDAFDFIIIPITHFHMPGFAISEEDAKNPDTRAAAWVRRLDAVLGMDLPFYKIGLAHLTCPLIAPTREEYLQTLDNISEKDMVRLFKKAADRGVGIELNASDMEFQENEVDAVLRPYRIAKACGCKFYLGSDAHTPEKFGKLADIFSCALEMLELTQGDKFII